MPMPTGAAGYCCAGYWCICCGGGAPYCWPGAAYILTGCCIIFTERMQREGGVPPVEDLSREREVAVGAARYSDYASLLRCAAKL